MGVAGMDESIKQALIKGTTYQSMDSARGSRTSLRARSRAGSVISEASLRRPSVMLEVPKTARSPSPVWDWVCAARQKYFHWCKESIVITCSLHYDVSEKSLFLCQERKSQKKSHRNRWHKIISVIDFSLLRTISIHYQTDRWWQIRKL